MPLPVEIDQEVIVLPSFTLECGETLRNVPVAYKTWGKLNEQRDNVMIICHAFTGSSDVEDWCALPYLRHHSSSHSFSFLCVTLSFSCTVRVRNYRFPYHDGRVSINRWGPLMGPGKAFDQNRFFILCANVSGSPYGTISPVSIDPDTGEPYGPSFPPTSIRDDILCVSFHPFVHVCNTRLTPASAR